VSIGYFAIENNREASAVGFDILSASDYEDWDLTPCSLENVN
jgi:hypothetical protein